MDQDQLRLGLPLLERLKDQLRALHGVDDDQRAGSSSMRLQGKFGLFFAVLCRGKVGNFEVFDRFPSPF